jgi:hypothetical protein
MAQKSTAKLKKYGYLLWSVCVLLTTGLCVAFSVPSIKEFDLAKEQVILRKIGHDILLSSGDSTSRVLPVRKIADNEYQIRFENEFTFQTNSLVQIIKKSLAKDGLAKDYIVNVIHCTNNEIVYGYLVLSTKKDDIVPCSGRIQKKGCYLINIKFQNPGINATQGKYLIGGLGLLTSCGLLFGFVLINSRRKFPKIEQNQFTLGNTLFNVQESSLFFGEMTTELTSKENKLLLIFAKSPK